MKKIYDFEVVIILTIIILMAIAIFAFKYGEGIDKSFFNTFLINNTEVFSRIVSEENKAIIEQKTQEIISKNQVIESSIILISIYIFVFINLIYFVYKIYKLFSKIKSKIIYKKYQFNQGEITEIDEVNFEKYDLISAYVIYHKRITFEKTQYLFESFYENQKYLLENNEINNELIKKLPANEQELLKYISFEKKVLSEMKMPSWSEIKDNIKKSFSSESGEEKNADIKTEEDIDKKSLYYKLLNNLKKEELVKHGTISMAIDKIIDYFEKLYNKLPNSILKIFEKIVDVLSQTQRSKFEFERKAGVNIFIFFLIVLFAIILSLSNIYVTMTVVVSIIILMFIFGNMVFLSRKGIVEREKICNYKKILKNKNKKDLTEREKLFLDLLY